jgi:uncharacterized protein
MTTTDKLNACKAHLNAFGKVAIAFSGGVDSSFLLALAIETLGAENVLAVTVHSELLADHETGDADAVARHIGATHITKPVSILSDPTVASNPPDRCYHCKKQVFGLIAQVAADAGIDHVLSGDNADDPSDYRPGMRALAELNIASPLKEAGLTKAEIRELSAERDLPTASKPSAACLASRVQYGLELTDERLRRIDAGERLLKDLDLLPCRLRDHGQLARIEVTPAQIPAAIACRDQLVTELRGLGWNYVTLDLAGFRSGSMNETL